MESALETYTVDDALSSVGFGKFQALVLAYSGLSWVAEAMELMLLSFIGQPVRQEWNVSAYEESLVSSIVFIGMLAGACCWGFISDIYGRKAGFLFTALFTGVVGFLSAFSPNYLCLLILRFFVGVGLGGGHIFASWFLEFVPARNRGAWMIVFSFFWTSGTILQASLAWAILPILNWRWLIALSAFPSFLLLLFFNVTPESARYLCARGRFSDATFILERMARVNNKDLPPGVLISSTKTKAGDNLNIPETTHLIIPERDESVVTEESSSRIGALSTFFMLLSPELIRSTLLIWVSFFGNIFAYYGVTLLTSELRNTDGSCPSNMKNYGLQTDDSLYKDIFLSSLAEIPGLLLSIALIDRIGRKTSMLFLLILASISLAPLLLQQKEVITISLLSIARAGVMGSSSILVIYAPEVYPTSVRSTGVGVATAIGRLGGIVCPLVAVGLMESCRHTEAILLFELVFILSIVSCALFTVETKGREIE